MDFEKAFDEIRRIAHELVDAEMTNAYTAKEISNREKARQNALECMRCIGKRQFEKIGKDEDWGT